MLKTELSLDSYTKQPALSFDNVIVHILKSGQ